MHELETVTIWLSLYIIGMLLTLLMPTIFPEPYAGEVKPVDRQRVASSECSDETRTLATMGCCGLSPEGLDLQTCCPSAI